MAFQFDCPETYGLVEFEITDPDDYVICLSQLLEDASDLPTPAA
jgi:hypothetical protein